MAKLTEQVLVSWLHGNKPIDKLLKTTRSTLDSVEQFVTTKLKGEVQETWLAKIAEYKDTNSETNSMNANVEVSIEEDYMNMKNELSLVEKELVDTEQYKAELIQKLKELESKTNELTEKKDDLLGKIAEIEQSLAINLVYDDTQIDKYNLNFFATFDSVIKDVDINENEIGIILSRNFMKLPKNISVQEAIVLVKIVIFIQNAKNADRVVRVYGPVDIIEFIKSCDVLNNYDIETIVT